MAKQSSPDRVTSASANSHGFLRGLIDYLHHLIIVVSSKLRHTQMHHSPMGDAKGDYDIWKKLGSHLEQVPVIEKHATKPHAIRRGALKGQKHSEIGQKHSEKSVNPPMPAGSEPSELRERNKSRAALQQQPRISEQLQSKTMEHINIALILAAEGNQDGVKLHIDLANSAMHTASRFMSLEDYHFFEEKVESRVKSIIDGDRHDDTQG